MKLQIEARQIANGFIYEAKLLGSKLTLSRALVEHLKASGKLKKEIDADPSWIITAQAKERNGRTYTNLYLTMPKPKTDAPAPTPATAPAADDLPF